MIAAVGLMGWGCGQAPAEAPAATRPLVLSTFEADFDVEGDLLDQTCDGDWQDEFDDLAIRVVQDPTGFSVFVDDDVGWIPCAGWVEGFDCRWGTAAGDAPDGVWHWVLEGTVDEDQFDATLTITLACDGADDCEPCYVIGTVQGAVGRR